MKSPQSDVGLLRRRRRVAKISVLRQMSPCGPNESSVPRWGAPDTLRWFGA